MHDSEQARGRTGWWVAALVVMTLTVTGIIISRLGFRRPPLPVLGQVEGFQLTNQLGKVVTATHLEGQIWVADIIFTRCPGPCLKMSHEMALLQKALGRGAPVKLISLTADPEYDTVEVLESYAARYGADAERWQFLTGNKAELYRLAIDSLKLAVGEISPQERENILDLFVHSTKFVLVDRQGAIRGIYEGTDPESRPRILQAIGALRREIAPEQKSAR